MTAGEHMQLATMHIKSAGQTGLGVLGLLLMGGVSPGWCDLIFGVAAAVLLLVCLAHCGHAAWHTSRATQ